jgi:diguanylate cyclase (GGDEF)-like protein
MTLFGAKPHRILILGGGRGGSALLEMLLDEPLVRVVGMADKNPDAPGMQIAREKAIATYDDIETALQACAPCLAFNLTGNEMVDAVVANTLGAGGIIGGLAARMLWKIVTGLKDTKEQLRFEATHDPLTGIYNRRHILSQLQAGIAQAMRYAFPYSVVMIDLDHFKAVNDMYGHSSGDTVLKRVVDSLGSSIRQTDTLGRWGGEEFLVLLPHTRHGATVTAAEKWLAKLKATPVAVVDGTVINISFSAGVSTYAPGDNYTGAEETAEALLRLADHHLYIAKEKGRCRVAGSIARDSAAL